MPKDDATAIENSEGCFNVNIKNLKITMHEVKYSVLTFLFGNYEMLREIVNPDPEAEYVLLTDNIDLQSTTWRVVYDSRLADHSLFDKCYYVRYHIFEYVHTDICVRIDGSILVKDKLSPIIERFNRSNADVAVMINPVFTYLHEDYEYWINNRNYPRKCAEKCLSKLYELGYDSHYRGYYQICFQIERKNKLTEELDDMCYQLLLELGEDGVIERFDQPIWSFILNKFFSNRIKVMPVDEYLITFSKYLSWCWHNSTEIIPYKIINKSPYLFNKPTKIEHFDYLHSIGNYRYKYSYYKRLAILYQHKLKQSIRKIRQFLFS